ncbi:MAG: DUF1080 domain-containing protein [Sediminibacterium sp.]|nr:DUF1080 domain-containing protein [Sediminibacterium sp.]
MLNKNFKIYFIVMATCFIHNKIFSQHENHNMTNKNPIETIFDGKTLNGWHSYRKNEAGKAWKIVDGAIYLDTSNKKQWQIKEGGDLVYKGVYKNFHLWVDWKISPGGNSGIIFLCQDEPKKYDYVWYTGAEMQVLDDAGYPGKVDDKQKVGGLYDLYAPSKMAANPIGDWNTSEIIFEYPKLTLKLNGVVTVSTDVTSADFEQRLNESKFRKDPSIKAFLKSYEGHIALQDHGHAVYFKNIKIQKL